MTPPQPKGKGKDLDTCYSATYMSQTRDQQRFTISEVAARWHQPMVPQRITWPFIAHANRQNHAQKFNVIPSGFIVPICVKLHTLLFGYIFHLFVSCHRLQPKCPHGF